MPKPDPSLADPHALQCVRSLLERHGYTSDAICRRAQCESLDRYVPRRTRQTFDALDVLIRLFLDEDYVTAEDMATHLDATELDALTSAGLIYEERGLCAASGLLYPLGPLWLYSDRNQNPDGSPHVLADDAVYPAITRNTLEFLRLLPQTPCERLLEVCAGAGPAALLGGSSYARHAVATDITARSAHFIRFNAALNGVSNIEARTGDLFEPVADESFDRIAAHPPYVPQQESKSMIFRDGGADGEQVSMGVIAGAQHLTPDGRLYMLTYATDRNGATYEQRIRQVLGAREDEFDLLLCELVGGDPFEALPHLQMHQRVKDWPAFVEEHQIAGLFYGLVVIQRRASERPVFTMRRTACGGIASADVDGALSTATQTMDPDFPSKLPQLRPRVRNGLVLDSRHTIENGELCVESLQLRTRHPLPYESPVPAWMVHMLQQADGARSVSELHRSLEEQQMISATPETFALAVIAMIQAGFIDV